MTPNQPEPPRPPAQEQDDLTAEQLAELRHHFEMWLLQRDVKPEVMRLLLPWKSPEAVAALTAAPRPPAPDPADLAADLNAFFLQKQGKPPAPAPPRPPAQDQRVMLFCHECGRSTTRLLVHSLESGWPLCCGYTMRLNKPAALTAAPRPPADWNEAEDLVGREAAPRCWSLRCDGEPGKAVIVMSETEAKALTGYLETLRKRPAEARPPAPDRCQSVRDGQQCVLLRFHDSSMNATPHEYEARPPAPDALRELIAEMRSTARNLSKILIRQDAPAVLNLFADRLEALSAGGASAPPVTATVSELRAGEENDGPLESTDLFVTGRGVSLLVNVLAGEKFTYSFGVDGNHVQDGTVGGASAPPGDQP